MMRKFGLQALHDIMVDNDSAVKKEFEKYMKPGDIDTIKSKFSQDLAIIDNDINISIDQTKALHKAIVDDKVDVAYGSRFINLNLEAFMLPNLLGNKFITTVFNIFFNTHFTDVETCYKAFNAKFLEGVDIKSTSFDFEPEITAKMVKKKVRIQEFPISYVGRKYHEGKKVSWIDAIHAVNAIIKFRFFN